MRKLNNNEWAELMGEYAVRVRDGEREGQAYMNALRSVNKEIYDHISATCADCFYKDSKVHNFIRSLTRGYIVTQCNWCEDYFKNTDATYLGIYPVPDKNEEIQHWVCHSCNVKYSLA